MRICAVQLLGVWCRLGAAWVPGAVLPAPFGVAYGWCDQQRCLPNPGQTRFPSAFHPGASLVMILEIYLQSFWLGVILRALSMISRVQIG